MERQLSKQTYGEVLRQLRTKGDASQAQFARLAKVDDSTITKLEVGTRKPVRWISFYERLREIPWLSEPDVTSLLDTSDAPRWLSEEEDKLAPKRFGVLLKSHREKAGLSQSTLASQFKIDDSTITKIEDGTRRPPTNPSFYDQLPKLLDLSKHQYAALLLTGNPPRWLVPHLYQDYEGISTQGTVDIGPFSVNFRILMDPDMYKSEDLEVIEELTRYQLESTLSHFITDRNIRTAILDKHFPVQTPQR